MAISKVTSTHLQLHNMGALHVEGTRLEVLRILETVQFTDMGTDLPLLVQRERTDPFQRSMLWVGRSLLLEALVADEHVVDVSDAPFEAGEEGTDLSPATARDDGLKVTL